MKKAFITILTILLFCSIVFPCYAEVLDSNANNPTAQPYFLVLTNASSGISISPAKSATCTGIAKAANSNYTIKIAMVLQKETSNSWTNLASWRGEGSGLSGVSLSKVKTGLSSGSYRTRVHAAIYDSNGNYVEGTTVYSKTVVC